MLIVADSSALIALATCDGLDDHRARAIAEHNQINCIGALGLLLVAKQKRKIRTITPYLQKLRNSSIYYGEALLDRVLKLAGE